jgi:hypothetical protein
VSDGTDPTSTFVDTHPGGGAIKAVDGVVKSGNVEHTAVPESSSRRSRDSTARYVRFNVEFFMIVFLKWG